jgi:hypothetical protein
VTDQRALLLSHDHQQAIEHGARLLATLAAVERAHMLGDEQEVEVILAGIDPVEVRLTANTLQALSFLWHTMPQVRGGTDDADESGATATVAPLFPSVTAAAPPTSEQPSAPIIPLDPYLRKVPCA